ncbi:ABC transporter ATP-binding protein [Halobaculum sp. P14]|uniref:ABC transporter ATP-binding protein n=1 Tax=Halobaculum sp. P14 TaxID=3421638 RepID=UPI003EB9EBB4
MLHADSLTFTYAGEPDPALNDVSVSVDPGEALGLAGPVGAGKTTLCMALAGFVPSVTGGTLAGDIELDGVPLSEANDAADGRRVGMVFEDFGAQMTQVYALDEVMAPLRNSGVPREEAAARARELLDRVGLGDLDASSKRTWELSGGQQQRVAVAAVLAMDPDVVIFDNATGMLDPRGKERLGGIIDDLAGDTSVIVVDDDPDFLAERVDRLGVMDDGDLRTIGPTETVLRSDDFLDTDGVHPPTPLHVADGAGLPGAPLTDGEFERTVRDAGVGDVQRQTVVPDGFGPTQLSVDDAVYEYGDGTRAVDSVSLDVHANEVRAVVGGNGAGKTTLTKLLAGLSKPDDGTVTVCGTDTTDSTAMDLAWDVGTAFQNPDEQLSEATVREELAYPLERRRYERTGWFSKETRFTDDEIESRVEYARELVGLDEELMERDPTLFPRGHRRLVTIAEALVLDPDVVVLDEPMVGLDAAARNSVHETIERLRDAGKAVVLVEHDMDLVCSAADTVTVLVDGAVATTGETRSVFAPSNWERLVEWDVAPPRAARLADDVDVDALSRRGLTDVLTEVSA